MSNMYISLTSHSAHPLSGVRCRLHWFAIAWHNIWTGPAPGCCPKPAYTYIDKPIDILFHIKLTISLSYRLSYSRSVCRQQASNAQRRPSNCSGGSYLNATLPICRG